MNTEVATIYAEQVNVSQLLQNLLYASGVVGAIFIVVGLLLIDSGGIRRGNIFNATAEKLVGFFIGVTVYYIIGFAIWAAQYYVMLEGPDYPATTAFMDSIKALWIGGDMMNARAQNVDPELFPGLNNFQIFAFFLAVFAGIINVLLHFSISERMKPSAYYVTCVVATLVSSVLSFASWGSVGPLTNAGFHDFFGGSFVYMFPAGMALVFAKVLGARPGMFVSHLGIDSYSVPNLGLGVTGVMLIFAGLPMVILSCLYFIDPGVMAVSVTMADTSVGIAFNNYAAAWAGGALTGAIIAYAKRKYSYLLLGPLAGYVSGTPGFDVYTPWVVFLVACAAPFVAYAVYELMQKMHIDEHKLIPLFGGVAAYGFIMVGILYSGTPHGGYMGIEEGAYAFQHTEISLLMQIVGVAVCLGTGILTALVLLPILKVTTGLFVSDEDQAKGLDLVYWDVDCDAEFKKSTDSAMRVDSSVDVGSAMTKSPG